jgi:hypothetical protein
VRGELRRVLVYMSPTCWLPRAMGAGPGGHTLFPAMRWVVAQEHAGEHVGDTDSHALFIELKEPPPGPSAPHSALDRHNHQRRPLRPTPTIDHRWSEPS